jgi:hypothetical protein
MRHAVETAQMAQIRAARERRACFIAVLNRSEGIPMIMRSTEMMTIIQ